MKTCCYWCPAKSLQSCLTPCNPTDGSPPGSAVPGICQARILEWVAIYFSNAWKWKRKVKSFRSCPTSNEPMDCSLPGSSVHGIFFARILECIAIAFSILVSNIALIYFDKLPPYCKNLLHPNFHPFFSISIYFL